MSGTASLGSVQVSDALCQLASSSAKYSCSSASSAVQRRAGSKLSIRDSRWMAISPAAPRRRNSVGARPRRPCTDAIRH